MIATVVPCRAVVAAREQLARVACELPVGAEGYWSLAPERQDTAADAALATSA